MNEYTLSQDLKSIREILGLSQAELAAELGIKQETVSRSEGGQTKPSRELLEKVYGFAFRRNIRLNRLKEMFWKESITEGHQLLFHGAKTRIDGPVNIHAGRANTDFGQGFYAGETYEQAVSFVAGFDRPSVYFLDFDGAGLKSLCFSVNQDWMMTIAFFRGALTQYKAHPMIQSYAEKVRQCDYVIAPIADNRMFQIIDSFINGEITDEQCNHCLAATNLGSQYVMVSEQAAARIRLIERCYVSENEKAYYSRIRSSEAKLGEDKVKMARIRFRGKGRYIDEILAREDGTDGSV